jgi:hypothetical protein
VVFGVRDSRTGSFASSALISTAFGMRSLLRAGVIS